MKHYLYIFVEVFRFSDKFEANIANATKLVCGGPMLVSLGVSTYNPFDELVECYTETLVDLLFIEAHTE